MTVWLAPAKVNLFLHVVRRRPDGYHDLQTVYQLIDWYDELEFRLTSDGSVFREPKCVDGITQEDDLTCRAARLLKKRFSISQGVRIRLRKNIPVGAGLGGGSSDAAVALKVLNRYWDIGMSDAELAQIGVSLGADVPFFLHGRAAWGEGIGDRLLSVSVPHRLYLVAVPEVAVLTGEIFKNLRLAAKTETLSPDDWEKKSTRNELEDVVRGLYPEVNRLLKLMRKFGPARMTGSGGAIFLPIDSYNEGERIVCELPRSVRTRLCASIDTHPMQAAICEIT